MNVNEAPQKNPRDEDEKWTGDWIAVQPRAKKRRVTKSVSRQGTIESNVVEEAANPEIERKMNNMKYAKKMLKILNENQSSIDQVKGKDIVVFLGSTGVGKSTTINFLAGCKIKSEAVDVTSSSNSGFGAKGGEDFSVDDCKIVIACENPVTKIGAPYSVESETDAVSVCESNEKFAFCDTPGFEDTKGFIQDFANAVNIAAALRNCRSFKLVFITEEFNADKGITQGKTLAVHTIGKFVSPLRDVIPGMTMFVTKGPREGVQADPKHIWKQIRESIRYHKNIENQKYLEACGFWEEMMKRLRDPQYLPYLVVNPLKDRTPYLNIIDGLQSINPKKVNIGFPFKNWQIAKIEGAFETLCAMILEDLRKDKYQDVAEHLSNILSLSENFNYGNFNLKKQVIVEDINKHLSLNLYSRAVGIIRSAEAKAITSDQAVELGSVYYKLQNACASLKVFREIYEIHKQPTLKKELLGLFSALQIIAKDEKSLEEIGFDRIFRNIESLTALRESPRLRKSFSSEISSRFDRSVNVVRRILKETQDNVRTRIKPFLECKFATMTEKLDFDQLKEMANHIARQLKLLRGAVSKIFS